MVRLEKVSERTFKKVLDMKLSDEQNKFVAPNIVSMAQAWLYYDNAYPCAVCDGDEVVGFMMLDRDEDERSVGIWRFMIAPEHQRKGYGRAAVEEAIRLTREEGKYDIMYLDYVPGNTVARELYASLGFRENGEVDNGEIIMTLPLTDEPKIGVLTADEDDTDDFLQLINGELSAGREVMPEFSDEKTFDAAIKAKQVLRLTLMAKTVGIYLHGQLLANEDCAMRLSEMKAAVKLFCGRTKRDGDK